MAKDRSYASLPEVSHGDDKRNHRPKEDQLVGGPMPQLLDTGIDSEVCQGAEQHEAHAWAQLWDTIEHGSKDTAFRGGLFWVWGDSGRLNRVCFVF